MKAMKSVWVLFVLALLSVFLLNCDGGEGEETEFEKLVGKYYSPGAQETIVLKEDSNFVAVYDYRRRNIYGVWWVETSTNSTNLYIESWEGAVNLGYTIDSNKLIIDYPGGQRDVYFELYDETNEEAESTNAEE